MLKFGERFVATIDNSAGLGSRRSQPKKDGGSGYATYNGDGNNGLNQYSVRFWRTFHVFYISILFDGKNALLVLLVVDNTIQAGLFSLDCIQIRKKTLYTDFLKTDTRSNSYQLSSSPRI